MTDVLEKLPPFQWRGAAYPVLTRNVGFQHDNVQHKFQYRDGELIEQQGARALTFRYGLSMRQDIAKGPYRNMFTEGLPRLLRDMLNRDEGPLIDPVYGSFNCVPASFDDTSDANKRDGTDVQVEYTLQSSLDEDQQLQVPTLQDIATEAGALDGELARAEWHQEPPPPSNTDILSAINGVLFQGQRAIDKVSGTLNDLAFRLEKIETTIDRTTDPKNWPLKRDVRRLRELILRVAIFGETPLRPRPRVAIRSRMTIAAAAAKYGMTVQQFLILNPTFARGPFVPAGASIRVPSG